MPLSLPPAPAPRPLRWSARTLLWAGLPALALVLAGAAVLAATGNRPPFQGLDVAWHKALLSSRSPWLTGVNQVLDLAGNAGMVMYGLALFLALLFRHRRLALFTAGANLGTLGVTHLIKFTVGRARPLDWLVPVDPGSYPSGHVSATVAAAVTTGVVLGRLWIWIGGMILSVAMMYSRMYLGAHWLSDTIAGALLGAGLTLLLWALVRKRCLEPYIEKAYAPASS